MPDSSHTLRRDFADFRQRAPWWSIAPVAMIAFCTLSTVANLILGRWGDAWNTIGPAGWTLCYLVAELEISRLRRALARTRAVRGGEAA